MPSPPKIGETSRRCTQRSLTWMSDTESVTFNLKLTTLRRPAKRIMVLVDSGATHHITPHHSDFTSWTPAIGTVSLGGHAEIAQVGTGIEQLRSDHPEEIRSSISGMWCMSLMPAHATSPSARC